MPDTKDIHVNPADFNTQPYTDASKTYGVGGVMGTELLCPSSGTGRSCPNPGSGTCRKYT